MDITELLQQDAEPSGDATSNLDLQAAMVVQKLASQHQFDVNDLDPEQYQELIEDAKVKIASAAAEQQQGAGGAEEGAKVAGVDQRAVISEITKRAAASNVDISDLSDEEYADVYNTIAEQLADPGYHAEIEAFQHKLASAQEAYEIGQYMSQGFVDGLNIDKTAGAKEMAGKGIRKADELLRRLGDKAVTATRKGQALRDTTRRGDVAGTTSEAFRRNVDRAVGGSLVAGGAGAAGAAGYAGKKKMEDSKKTAQAVHARALELIAEEEAKLASEAGDFTDEQFEELARQHAIELVREG